MCQKSEELKEKNLQNSPVQRYIKLSRLDLFFSAINNRKLYGPLWGMCLFKFCHNLVETFSLPTDAHNVKKHRVIKTF